MLPVSTPGTLEYPFSFPVWEVGYPTDLVNTYTIQALFMGKFYERKTERGSLVCIRTGVAWKYTVDVFHVGGWR